MELGYRVYDVNPEEVEYPYVVMGEQFKQNYREHKDGIYQQTQVSLHVWHNNPRQRGTFTSMIDRIELGIIDRFGVNGEDITVQVIGDPEDRNLLHGIIDTDIKINSRRG